MYAEPDRVRFVVVGIGINVNQTRMPDSLAKIATSLRVETGRVHSRIELTVRLLRSFESYYNQLLLDGAGSDPRAICASFQLRRGETHTGQHRAGLFYRHHGRFGRDRDVAREASGRSYGNSACGRYLRGF